MTRKARYDRLIDERTSRWHRAAQPVIGAGCLRPLRGYTRRDVRIRCRGKKQRARPGITTIPSRARILSEESALARARACVWCVQVCSVVVEVSVRVRARERIHRELVVDVEDEDRRFSLLGFSSR